MGESVASTVQLEPSQIERSQTRPVGDGLRVFLENARPRDGSEPEAKPEDMPLDIAKQSGESGLTGNSNEVV